MRKPPSTIYYPIGLIKESEIIVACYQYDYVSINQTNLSSLKIYVFAPQAFCRMMSEISIYNKCTIDHFIFTIFIFREVCFFKCKRLKNLNT